MPRAAPDNPLLLIHQGALGDFIATFPILRALGGVFDPIDAVCRDSFGALAQSLGLIRRHEPIEAARFASLYGPPLDPAVRRLLRSYRSLLLFSFSEILEESVRGEVRRVFRVPPWPSATEKVAVADFLAERLLRSGIFGSTGRDRFETAWAAGENAAAAEPPERILLAPGAGSPQKRWPLARFLSLAGNLAQLGLQPEILLGPAEADIESQLAESRDPIPPQIRPESLVSLADQLASCGGFIGNDSAAGHLAAFSGVPTLVIFGPTDPVRWAPAGRWVRVVQAEVDCGPGSDFGRPECANSARCLESIAPQQVLHSFLRLRRQWRNHRCGPPGSGTKD